MSLPSNFARGQLICIACARSYKRASVARKFPGEPAPHEVRDWAMENGIPVSMRGRLSDEVRAAYRAAHAPSRARTG